MPTLSLGWVLFSLHCPLSLTCRQWRKWLNSWMKSSRFEFHNYGMVKVIDEFLQQFNNITFLLVCSWLCIPEPSIYKQITSFIEIVLVQNLQAWWSRSLVIIRDSRASKTQPKLGRAIVNLTFHLIAMPKLLSNLDVLSNHYFSNSHEPHRC